MFEFTGAMSGILGSESNLSDVFDSRSLPHPHLI
jgi:hypothetical protein